MATRAMGSFHVYGRQADAERLILETADDYRARLVALTHRRHQQFVELRNELFPDLFAALCRFETARARISLIEDEIKKLHSDVRDRNAVTAEQDAALRSEREARDAAARDIKTLRLAWSSTMRAFALWWQGLSDWKNVKTLSKRRALYAALPAAPTDAETYQSLAAAKGKELPGLIAATLPRYAALWMEYDLLERELNEEFSPRLHPAIRAEIVEASQPKLSKTSPGIRYEYHRAPEPKPWTKLTLQFGGGGLTVAKAIEGTPAFTLTPIYTNHKAQGDKTVYEVTQQIGTKANPALITYRAKIHRPFAEDAVLKRWSLIVSDEGRRACVPLVSTATVTPALGDGAFRYSLSWTQRKAGIEVARFEGTHVSESLIVPGWLVERRLSLKAAQQATDLAANEFLQSRDATPQPQQKQGVEALAVYAAAHLDDAAAQNLLDNFEARLARAARIAKRALRAIEEIYHVAAARVCALHESYLPCDLDLSRLKKYDTRDLLREDVLPPKSRELLFAVAPGKLKQFIDSHGLPVASAEVIAALPSVSRDTDHVTSYVHSLGVATGRKTNYQRRCSRHDAQTTSLS